MASILTVATIHFNAIGTTKLEVTGNVARFTANAVKFGGGTTTDRPSPETGLIRYNTTLNALEFSNATTWANVASSVDTAILNNALGLSFNKANAANLLAFTTTQDLVTNVATLNSTINSTKLDTLQIANSLSGLAFNKANAANVTADSALPKTGGTITGSLTATGSISDGIGNVRVVPINSQSGAYVLAGSDIGKFVSITTGGITVPNTIFKAGDAVSIYNNSGSSQTIANAVSVTMYLSGTASLGNRTLAQRGLATVLCVAANTFVVTGSGIS